jgi:pyruvate dehydrogenase E1 component alpha subunit
MRVLEVDGQDVEAVFVATREAREHAIAGDGPTLLHVRTQRFTGHYVGDPQVYREKDEVRQLFETQDPIEHLRAKLGISDDDFEALDQEVTAEVEESVEFAKAGTDPDPEHALDWVYADGNLAPNA